MHQAFANEFFLKYRHEAVEIYISFIGHAILKEQAGGYNYV